MEVAADTWRVDIELPRDAVTGRRRRVSRTIRGTREEAELALSRLRVVGHERRLPSGGTNARSAGAAMDLYLHTAESGSLELSPKTITTTRSAIRVMKDAELSDGRRFGAIRLSRLTWQDIEDLYAAMRRSGRGPDWVRRCGTVLTRALELARKRGLIDTNPSKDAVRPKSTRKKPFAPLEVDVRALLKSTARRRRSSGAPCRVGGHRRHDVHWSAARLVVWPRAGDPDQSDRCRHYPGGDHPAGGGKVGASVHSGRRSELQRAGRFRLIRTRP